MRTRFPKLTVVVAVVALSGCEAMNSTLFPEKSDSAADQPAGQAPPAQTASIVPNLRPGVKPSPTPKRIDPKSLVGKNQGDIRDLLGVPTTVQNAAPATIWRYTAQACSLDIFFYMDLGTNTLRALTYDTKLAENAANDDATSRCLGIIQTSNRVSTR